MVGGKGWVGLLFAPIIDFFPANFVASNGDIDLRMLPAATMDIVEDKKLVEVSVPIEAPVVQMVDIKRRASEDQKAPSDDEPTIKKTKNEDIDL